MPDQAMRSVVIIGAGPVGCALAILLRRQGIDVDIFERAMESASSGSGRSFNLTLTSRGLDCLPMPVKRRLYLQGTVLTKRIIHHRDGAISTQPYGTAETHHLLSIPRQMMQDILRDQALREGARIHYGQTCVDVDTTRPAALIRDRTGTSNWIHGDLLVGCDGANSAVREVIAAAHPAQMWVTRETIAHGYAEIPMNYGDADPTGMHLWPRGDHFLQAQPNRDHTFTTSLFKPLTEGTGPQRFSGLLTVDAISTYCAREFPDVVARMSGAAEDLAGRAPGQLRIVSCGPYHHQRAILVGDAAHTVVPFFGQGINCSFEDAAALAALLEKFAFTGQDYRGTVTEIIAQEYSDVRAKAGHALAELSMQNLRELADHVNTPRFLARRALERRLHELRPDLYTPLYQMVAFTHMPYDQAQRVHEEFSDVLDTLCRGRDLHREQDTIIGEFVELSGHGFTARTLRTS